MSVLEKLKKGVMPASIRSVRSTPTAFQDWQNAFKALEGNDKFRTIKVGNKYPIWAEQTEDGFGAPQVMPGLVNTSLEPQTSEVALYADDIIHYGTSYTSSYQGDIQLRQLTKAFRSYALGDYEDESGLTFASIVSKKAFFFGFVESIQSTEAGFEDDFQFTGYYNCTVSDPTDESETISADIPDSPLTLTITASPSTTVLVNGKGATKFTLKYSEQPDLFNMLMTEVLVPTTTVVGEPTITIETPIVEYASTDTTKTFADLATDAGISAVDGDEAGTDLTSTLVYAIGGTQYSATDTIPGIDSESRIDVLVTAIGATGSSTETVQINITTA